MTEPQGTQIKADPARLEIVKDCVRNIATWLHPAARAVPGGLTRRRTDQTAINSTEWEFT